MKSFQAAHLSIDGGARCMGILPMSGVPTQTNGHAARATAHPSTIGRSIHSQAGTTIAVAVIMILVIGIIIASVTSIVASQRRLAIHREAALIANNTAETALDYAYSYIMKDIKANTITSSTFVPHTAGTVQTFTFPVGSEAESFLKNPPALPTGYSGTLSNVNITLNSTNVKIQVEAPTQVTVGTAKMYKVGSAGNANAQNQWVTETVVPIVAQVTAKYANQSYTAMMQKSIDVIQVSLFQDAIFFQGSLMLHRGYPDLGSIHTNGNLAINAHGGETGNYSGEVSASKSFFRGQDFENSEGDDGPYAYNPVDSSGTWTAAIGTTIESHASQSYGEISVLVANSTTGLLALETSGAAKPTDSNNTCWTNKSGVGSAGQFNGNLRDQAQSTAVVNPTGSAGYQQAVPVTPQTDNFVNGPYSLIEPLLPTGNTYRWSDNSNNLEARASLIFRIECTKSGGIVTSTTNGTVGTTSWDLSTTTNPHCFGDYFVVKAYKNPSTNWGVANPTATLIPVALPMEVIGQVDDSLICPVSADPISTNIFNAATTPSTKTASNLYYRTNRILGAGNGNGALVKTGSGSSATYSCVATALPNLNGDGTFESYLFNTQSSKTYTVNTNAATVAAAAQTVATGLHDSRMARGVNLLTIDLGKLKQIMEADPSTFSAATDAGKAAKAFRDTFAVATEWNGVLYVELPTALTASTTASVVQTTDQTSSVGWGATDARTSYKFDPGTPELRHPDRMGDTDDCTASNAYLPSGYTPSLTWTTPSRADNMIPIAPQLRGYPPASSLSSGNFPDSVLENPTWAIPAIQIINAQLLPNPVSSRTGTPIITGNGSATTPTTVYNGFTIATNAPIYLVGDYNSDGDTTTPSATSYLTAPSASNNYAPYQTPDVAVTGWVGPEVPSAIFCDYLTILSNNWESVRANSEPGQTGDSGNLRKVPATGTGSGAVEISACIATGEYPIFEFMLHALEHWGNFYYPDSGNADTAHHNPIVIRGSVCGMFHSEFQHIKQAYNRDATMDMQNFYSGHGYDAIPSVRFSQWLSSGIFPPGTPTANIYSQRDFRLLRPGNAADMTIIQSAGLTVQSGAN
jgi:Tfp pilus assembly protein PilX